VDGQPEEANPPRHSYYWATQTTQRDVDPQVACTTFCSVSQSRSYYDHWFDGTTKAWKCQCTALSPPNAPGTIHTAGAGNELHCSLGDAFVGAQGSSCAAGGPGNCRARQGEYVNFLGVANPAGFNVPTDDEANGTTFETLKGCSLKRASSNTQGSCFQVSYFVTGSGRVDEDGLPNANHDGASWPDGLIAVCDPETGDPVEGGWSGTGGGGVFDLSPIIEEETTPEDPTDAAEASMAADTDSWLDTLTEPVTWTESVFEGFGIDFALWNVVSDDCIGSSLHINLQEWAGPGAEFTISCESTATFRQWSGVVISLMFGWWLINMALTVPRT